MLVMRVDLSIYPLEMITAVQSSKLKLDKHGGECIIHSLEHISIRVNSKYVL